MTELLFDTPWWLPVLIGTVGVVLFITGNKRVQTKVRYAGLGVIGLAILLAAVSYFVDTPTETALKKSKQLITSFDKQDWTTFASVLDRDTDVSLHSLPIYQGREDIVAAAKKAYQQYGFTSANVLMSHAERVDTQITVDLTLLTQQTSLGRPMNSDWQFEWQQSADGWRLVEVRALQIGQQKGEDIRRLFPSR